MEQEYLEDLKQRISLNANHLPSICFYTIFNTYQSMNTLEISQDSSLVAGGFSNSSVRLWNIKKGTPLHEKHSTNDNQNSKLEDYNILVGHSGPVYSASFSPDNLFLLTGSEDHTVRLWCTQTCLNIACYKSHNYPVWDTIFSPLGCYFATASHDRTARFWCTERITPIRIFAGHLSDVNCVNFHPNCNYIATGSSDKSVRLWDVFSASPVRIFTGHFGSIDCLALSPDGKLIASAGDDNRIIVWDLATSKKLYTFIGHKKSIWSLDFSAESSLLASGSHDETICIWDISGQYKSENVLLEENDKQYSNELIKIFPTKQTPIFKVKYTRRNLLLAGGPYTPID
jgi:transcription initiation factor TFIID subunit 5